MKGQAEILFILCIAALVVLLLVGEPLSCKVKMEDTNAEAVIDFQRAHINYLIKKIRPLVSDEEFDSILRRIGWMDRYVETGSPAEQIDE